MKRVNFPSTEEEVATTARVLDGVRQRNSADITDLVAMCMVRLRAICQHQLDKRSCHGIEDADDIANLVIGKFVEQLQNGLFSTIRDANGFWGIVTYKANKRAASAARKFYKEHAHCLREADFPDDGEFLAKLSISDSVCEQFADSEELSVRLQQLDQKEHQIVVLCLAETPIAEIARQLNVTPRTIRNRLAKLLASWQRGQTDL